MNAHVVLINPPDPLEARAVREGAGGMGALSPSGGFSYPPHTLAVIAASLHRAGMPSSFVDAVAADWRFPDVLAQVPSEAVAIVQVSHATRDADAEFLRRLRQARPGVRSLVVGPAAVDAFWLSDGLAHAALVGEPDLAVPAAVQALLDGARGRLTPGALGVPGYDEHGRVMDLDALPFPAWDQVPWRAYGFLTLFSSRGCPDKCRYCPYVLGMGDRLRARAVDRVVEELRWLAERFAPPRVIFRDPVFAHDRDRVLALCEGIRRAGILLPWECESRPEHFDRALLEVMRAAGCATVKIGVESADPELLVALGRVADADEAASYIQHAREVAQAAADLGIVCRVFVMTGLPGETRTSVRLTADFLRQLPRASRVHIKPFTWYPGLGLPPGLGVREEWWNMLQRGASARGGGWRARIRSWLR
ncbi:MAG: radical SAM protein [Anaerolineae bacterium]|nr:radical SAM protein [Anaerolineae bacterium]